MHIRAYFVVGANYGDEGKGKVAAKLCKKEPDRTLNILTNGGAQRGHTFDDTIDGAGHIHHVFHHFGSGTLYGVDNYFADSFIVNPVMFREEYEKISTRHPVFNQTCVFCAPMCRFSTPWDMIANQILETARGNNRHGSCGMGIWETVLRYNTMDYVMRADGFRYNLWNKDRFIDHLIEIREYLENRILSEVKIPDEWRDFWENEWRSDDLVEHFLDDVEFFKDRVLIQNPIPMFKSHIEGFPYDEDYSRLVFENGQGLLLDSDKVNVHTTPSRTGAATHLKLIKHLPAKISVEYVTRSFITRHGAGPFPEESDIVVPTDFTNQPNEWQGSLRYGKINIPEFKARVLKDFNACKKKNKDITGNIHVTHLDVLDNYSEFEDAFKNISSIHVKRC